MRERLLPVALLLLLGIGWGSTQPLGKIAASGGQGYLALVFWQSLIATLVTGAILLLRRRPVPLHAAGLRFALMIALIGTLVPNTTFYMSVHHLPAGVMSIIISLIPMLSFPLALALRMESFSLVRLCGLACGLAGVAAIALPRASLPDPAMAGWLPVALVGPLCYALEANIVARWGTAGLGPMQAMFLVCLAAAVLALPLAIMTGQWFLPWPPGRPERALFLLSGLHGILYATYVGLARRAGAVFAAQTSYVVTIAGVGWAMLILGERFSLWVWAALPLLMTGLFLVQPRGHQRAPAEARP